MLKSASRLRAPRKLRGRPHFVGDCPSYIVQAPLVHADDPFKQRDALILTGLAIGFESATRCSYGSIHVGGVAHEDLTDGFLRGRVDDVQFRTIRSRPCS